MSELTMLLKQINESLKATSDSITKLESNYDHLDSDSGIVSHLDIDQNEKVSLLSLKNASMLSYITSLMSIVSEKLDTKSKDASAMKGREKSIENRVVLERGIKPLEKKLGYQLDKLVRAYMRAEKEYNDAKKRAEEKNDRNGHDEVENENSDDEGASSSEDEELSYRPNVIRSKSTDKKSKDFNEEQEGAEDNNDGIYRPPKINAMLPPQVSTHFEDKFSVKDHKDRSNNSRMQAMEEYIKNQSDQPDWGTSIGADILDHGRGGIKSSRATEKERRVTTFEEDNFTRVNHMGMNKTERKRQKQRQRIASANVIGGEDFGIFNSKRKLEDSTSRRNNKKPRSAWDRAKKRL